MAAQRHKARAGRGWRFGAARRSRTGTGSHTTAAPFDGHPACPHHCFVLLWSCDDSPVLFTAFLTFSKHSLCTTNTPILAVPARFAYAAFANWVTGVWRAVKRAVMISRPWAVTW